MKFSNSEIEWQIIIIFPNLTVTLPETRKLKGLPVYYTSSIIDRNNLLSTEETTPRL